MKYVDEFRRSSDVMNWAKSLADITTRPWVIMEVCGGQTHSIVKFGLQALLPKNLRLIHGPGCPVCVTPIEIIDHALQIAARPHVLFCTFGDMMRVPGTFCSLLTLKAKGADVCVVHSPLEALKLAEDHPQRDVVFFAVGFETTAPPCAMAVYQAKRLGIHNFFLLASHVLVPPALKFLLNFDQNEVQGFLAAGHVCTVTGYKHYHRLSDEYRVPIVVTGFEPLDILQGLYLTVKMLEDGQPAVLNQYRRCVREEGNAAAQTTLESVYKVVDRPWRGIGVIPESGLDLQETYAAFNAALRYPFVASASPQDNGCISGLILQGRKKPSECPLFGKRCKPESPLGAPMVSSEGACAAYYHYSRSCGQDL